MRPVRALAFEIAPPFSEAANGGLLATPAGGLAVVEDDRAIRQALMLLLSTEPGERVMRPAYGCPLNRLVFEPNDATTAGLAIHYVRQAILRFEPRIDIRRLDASSHPDDPGRIDIVLDYRARPTGRENRLEFSLDLGSAQE